MGSEKTQDESDLQGGGEAEDEEDAEDSRGRKRKRDEEGKGEDAGEPGEPAAASGFSPPPEVARVDAYGGGSDLDDDGFPLGEEDAATAAALAAAAAEAAPGQPEEEDADTVHAPSSERGGRRTRRHAASGLSLRRRLADVLRDGVELQVEVDETSNEEEHEDAEAEEGDGAEAAGNDEEGQDEDAAQNVVVLGAQHDNESNSSDSASEVDLSRFREQLQPLGPVALARWHSAVFRRQAELTGECALAVARWVERGEIAPADLDNVMVLCIVRCLERGYAMFEEEEDVVFVFTTAVALTEKPACVERLLELGALRAMIRGLQSSAHLLLEQPEDSDWVETEQLVRIYKAFKTLWQACSAPPAEDLKRTTIKELAFQALGRWLRNVPLQDVWIGEDDILVFWVLIPLWPHYLDYLEESPSEKTSEEKGRFKEVCNWVLWPNDPVVESNFRLIGHLDFKEGADFSLRFLLSEERFRWTITANTKQRYLQYRVDKVAQALQATGGADEMPRGLVLVVNRETPLQDLCKQLGVSGYTPDPINLTGGITVHFRGGDGESEEGIDEGGPWREAIPLMFSELVSPNHGLFELREDGECRTVEPRWCAAELVPDFQAQFELCGMLIGMALVYQAYAPVHFSHCFLKHLLGLKRMVEDVPGLAEQIRVVESAGASLGTLCLTFSVDDAATGRTIELLPGGADKDVDEASVEEYVRLRIDWELEGRFKPLMPCILKGLHCIVPPDVLEAFSRIVSAEELDVMLAGHGINIKDWRDHTEYDGFGENSDIVKWFWEAVEAFTAQEREDLWTFISGSKGVPPGGFGHLINAAGESIRFTIAKVSVSPVHLPVAHTCGYQLDLAAYETATDLAQKLRQAMSYRQGFGLA